MIPLIVDVDPFRELPGPERAYQRWPAFAAGDPVVLFLGRLHEIKGLDLLVPMLARLHADGCRARLLLAGNDEQGLADGLYAEARAAGLEDAVTLLGFVDGPEKRSLLQAADVVVLPSRHESWGYALIEAMLCGTPVVTTRNVKSWVELEGSGGAIIAEATPEALAASVGDLLADDDRRELMGRAARRWCLEHLEPAVVVDAFERLYAGPGEASG